MTRHSLHHVEFVAVLGDPPIYPWVPISSVVCAVRNEPTLLIADAVESRWVRGYPVPRAWLEDAFENGRATRLDPPIPGRDHHHLVRTTEDRYELRSLDAIVAARHAESARRLGAALEALQNASAPETIRDHFDAAYIVAPENIVTIALRAGAGVLVEDDEWREEVIDDLVRVSESDGVLLGNVPAIPPWNSLPHPALRRCLLDKATLALRDALAPPTELFDPIPPETLVRASAIAALWRNRGTRAIPGISQRVLRAALRGDPSALEEVEQRVTSWECAEPKPLDAARAQLTNLERFAQSVYALELRVERRDRGHSWRSFLSEVAGATTIRRPRPWQEGEALAKEVRHRLGWNGQPLQGLRQLAQNRAGVLVQAGEELEGVEALGVASGRVPPCVQFVGRAAGERPGLARFALAHELCHFIVDREPRAFTSWACSQGGEPGEHVSWQEKRARAFAAYFLAPREAVCAVAGEPIGMKRQSDFIERAIRVRNHFGLTAVTSGEHLLNCWDTEEGPRTRLDPEMRAALRETGDRIELAPEFRADCPSEPDPEVPATDALRRGVFSQLVRSALRTGQLDEHQASRLLGSQPAAREWLCASD